jgi:hypothetical protein
MLLSSRAKQKKMLTGKAAKECWRRAAEQGQMLAKGSEECLKEIEEILVTDTLGSNLRLNHR